MQQRYDNMKYDYLSVGVCTVKKYKMFQQNKIKVTPNMIKIHLNINLACSY